MSSKQLLRLAAVLGIVLVLWGAVALASRAEGRDEGTSILPKVDTASIDTIALLGSRDTAILAKVSGKWKVNGHAADPVVITELLKGLADTNASTELIAKNPSSHARLKVSDDSGRRVRIVRQGRTVAEFLAGKQTPDWGGVYLRRTNEPEVYVLRGDLPNTLARPAEDWRNRTIATVTADSVAAIEVRRGSRSYTVRRKDSTAWVFASGKPTDSTAIQSLLSDYKEVKAVGFSTPAEEDSLDFKKPRRTARLLDRRGTPIVSLAFDSLGSGIWARHDSGGPAYRLDNWTADRLTPADSTLRKP